MDLRPYQPNSFPYSLARTAFSHSSRFDKLTIKSYIISMMYENIAGRGPYAHGPTLELAPDLTEELRYDALPPALRDRLGSRDPLRQRLLQLEGLMAVARREARSSCAETRRARAAADMTGEDLALLELGYHRRRHRLARRAANQTRLRLALRHLESAVVAARAAG